MKKILMMVLAFVLSAACFINTAEAKYSLITAIRVYGPGEYAVKGLVEEQAKAMIKSWTKQPARILIEGSADKTGDKARNDEYGSKRPNDMKAFLRNECPDSPHGDFLLRSLAD